MNQILRVTILLSVIGLALSAHGQEIVRTGDRYTVGGQTYYNSTEFRGYLKATNPDVFTQYNQGYKIGMAGWGLLSFGVAVVPTSFIMLLINQDSTSDDPVTGEQVVHQIAPSNLWFGGWMSCFVVACASFTASIPMLGIGYHKMHKAVDVYNISQTTTAPQTYWSIRTSSNGIGIAYNF